MQSKILTDFQICISVPLRFLAKVDTKWQENIDNLRTITQVGNMRTRH